MENLEPIWKIVDHIGTFFCLVAIIIAWLTGKIHGDKEFKEICARLKKAEERAEKAEGRAEKSEDMARRSDVMVQSLIMIQRQAVNTTERAVTALRLPPKEE